MLSRYKQNSIKTGIVKNSIEFIQPTMHTEDLIKKTLEKNKIILPFKSPKLKLWYVNYGTNYLNMFIDGNL